MRKYLIPFMAALLVTTLAWPGSTFAGKDPCRRTSKRTQVVVCVDTKSQTAKITDGRGGLLLDLGTVTTSRIDSGRGDHITPIGAWRVSCMDPLSGDGEDECNPISDGLRWVIQFENAVAWNTALHQHSKVGPDYDSHGCVRMRKKVAADAFAIVFAVFDGGGRVEVIVY